VRDDQTSGAILVTGAHGFVGRRLVDRLLHGDGPPHWRDSPLLLLDQAEGGRRGARVRNVVGDLTDPRVLDECFSEPIAGVFHLASVPGGAAERDFELGLRVNLRGTLALLEAARQQQRAARFVFASTVGVYGAPLPARIDETTLPQPTLSYGAHKLAGETLVADYARRGWIEGVSLRLPGIVARPAAGGLLSAFMSQLIRELAAGRPFTCPVSPGGRAWWMSRSCVVENLLHAASLPAAMLRGSSAWLLPVLHASVGDVVAAVARTHGHDCATLVHYAPDAAIEAQFANLPPLSCPAALAAGFRHDGTLDRLVARSLEGP
jgi:nucleoside-diphosphate-sugar epimerase